jgi:hypothetical protein
METPEYKSHSDKTVCVEVFIHQKHDQPLCLDCQQHWDSWSEAERKEALVLGRQYYNDMFGLKNDGKS